MCQCVKRYYKELCIKFTRLEKRCLIKEQIPILNQH